MNKDEEININYKIDNDILKKYVKAINSIDKSMNQIKQQLNQMIKQKQKVSKSFKNTNEQLKNIKTMSDTIKNISTKFPSEQGKIFTDIIKQIMSTNNGMISTRMIEPLNISRQYISIMEKNNEIEKISRGIYLSPTTFEDSYFLFQQKYKKAIFSHMNALYFYGMTEEFPYNYTVTVPQRYHVNMVNEKCNVFYVPNDIYELGLTEVLTPNGNKVKAYDKERCICDIIRSKGRMDSEQVKKTIKQYVKSKDKNIAKLSNYAKKMGISEKVIEMVSVYYE
jgi:predicted transcriptional regulator of viral defense system